MNSKSEYLNQLEKHLGGIPEDDRKDILRDQNEYISEALRSGRTEMDVLQALGDPKILARNLIAELRLGTKDSPVTSTDLRQGGRQVLDGVLALIALTPFNLIFVLGPFCAAIGILIAFWTVTGVLFVLGLSAVVAPFTAAALVAISPWAVAAIVFGGLAVFGLGLAAAGIMFLTTRAFLFLTMKYLRWNYNLIVRKGADYAVA